MLRQKKMSSGKFSKFPTYTSFLKKQTGQGREISLAGTWLEKQSMFPKKEAKKCSSIQKLHSSFLAILPILKSIEFKEVFPLSSCLARWIWVSSRTEYVGKQERCMYTREVFAKGREEVFWYYKVPPPPSWVGKYQEPKRQKRVILKGFFGWLEKKNLLSFLGKLRGNSLPFSLILFYPRF